MQIRAHKQVPMVAFKGLPPKSTSEECKPLQDSVSISNPTPTPGAFLRGLRASAGVLGALVGGTLGLVPGVAVGLKQATIGGFGDTHCQTCDVGRTWSISYGWLGLAAAAVAARAMNLSPIEGVALASVAVPAVLAPQSLFRSVVRTSERAPGPELLSATLTYCADRALLEEADGIFSGALAGIVHGARQGKLAFQDLVAPSMKPSRWTEYRSPNQ